MPYDKTKPMVCDCRNKAVKIKWGPVCETCLKREAYSKQKSEKKKEVHFISFKHVLQVNSACDRYFLERGLNNEIKFV